VFQNQVAASVDLTTTAEANLNALDIPVIVITETNTPTVTEQVTMTETSEVLKPTRTSEPTATPSSKPSPATPIYFRPGGTSAYIQDWVQESTPLSYSLWIAEGQNLIVTATSENNDVYVDIVGIEDGVQLVYDAIPYWFGIVPKSQEYQITIWTKNPGTTFFLSIEVPANIEFDSGANSQQVKGYIEIHSEFSPDLMTRVRYRIQASEGQTLEIQMTSPNLDSLSMGIVGEEDGQTYLRYVVKNSGGTLELPSKQGYYLDVYATGGMSTDFTLEVSIE
jgi:hypothetical protein